VSKGVYDVILIGLETLKDLLSQVAIPITGTQFPAHLDQVLPREFTASPLQLFADHIGE
jgi:hypothetical protein